MQQQKTARTRSSRTLRKKLLLACASLALFLFVAGINCYMIASTRNYIYANSALVPKRYAAIVLGAKAYANNAVSFVFRDRIAGGMSLLESGTVQKLLISGDHGQKSYDEVNAALSYINTMYHVDDSCIFLDHAGFSTYDTMYRARDVFCVREAAVVTQRFHLYRALYIARKLGIDAVGYSAPEQNRFRREIKIQWELREILARVKAFFAVSFCAKPKYLGEQLPITGDGRMTRD
ncbi:MAG: YdcF family protein [Treponema sp.]|nr:YdcF family protein [Treponema sp.]